MVLVRTRVGEAVAVVLLVLLAACGSSSKNNSSSSNNRSNDNSSNTTAASNNRNFHVDTPDGQVSLSLNGQLPPNWPSAFPVPSGATPAGSGSLAGSNKSLTIGVYQTSEPPADVFAFYETNPALTVGNSNSAGAGSVYAGNLEISGTYDGNVSIISTGDTTYIIISLTGQGSGTTTTT